MSLALDARRVAMLREIGLRLLPPIREPSAEPEVPVARAGDPAAPLQHGVEPAGPTARAASGTPAANSPPAGSGPDVAGLDWDGLEAAARELAARDGLGRSVVLGSGPRRAVWMVIGEAPGEAEEQQGEPFAGAAGKLLDGMLRAIGLDRARDAYVTNLLKCRPPGDRNPEPDELAAWEPLLRREVALVQPRVLLVMGRFTVPRLLQTPEPIGRLRGRTHAYEGVPVVVTYHPTYLLRNLPDKARAWTDLCFAQAFMAGAQPGGSGR